MLRHRFTGRRAATCSLSLTPLVHVLMACMLLLPLVSLAEDTTPPEDDELPLPTVSLKYSHINYVGAGGNSNNVIAPLLVASNGHLYGMHYNRHGSGGSAVGQGQQSDIFRVNIETGAYQRLFRQGPNASVLNLVEMPDGDVVGLAHLGNYHSSCPPTGCVVETGVGIVPFRIPANQPDTVLIEPTRVSASLQEQLTALDQGTLIRHSDGFLYAPARRGNTDVVLLRFPPGNGDVEVAYRFNVPAAERPAGSTFSVWRVLSLATEPDTGVLAVVVAGGMEVADGAGGVSRPDEDTTVGALLRLDTQTLPATGDADIAYVFQAADVGTFSAADVTSAAGGNGYLVDAGEGWWYGNAGGAAIGAHLGQTADRLGGGLIYRIRHDGSGFQVLHRFTNTCAENVPPFDEPEQLLGLTIEEYNALTMDERARRSLSILQANDDCHRDWPEGKGVQGPLVRAEDEDGNTLVYGSAYKGGMPQWRGDDRPAELGLGGRYSNDSLGTVFRLFVNRAEDEGHGFQLVRPFRLPVGDNLEAAQPTGVTWGPDGRLYGLSSRRSSNLHPSANGQVAYAFEFNAADIDITHSSLSNLLPNQPLTISWWAHQVTQCEAYSASLAVWNGPLPITGERTITPLQAGNHRLEIICQNDSGSVYLERAFTVPVQAPPLTDDLFLELFDYKQDNAGSLSVMSGLVLLLVLGCRPVRRWPALSRYPASAFFAQITHRSRP